MANNEHLFEAEEIDEALRHTKRGPGLSEQGHRAIVESFVRQQRANREADAAEMREIADLLHEAERRGEPTAAAEIRAALGQRKAGLKQQERDRQRRAARAVVHGLPIPPPASIETVLPGGFRWSEIEAKYRELGANQAGYRHRRRKPDEPSRPELAKALNTSPPTLKRACAAAGKGAQWPPRGILTT